MSFLIRGPLPYQFLYFFNELIISGNKRIRVLLVQEIMWMSRIIEIESKERKRKPTSGWNTIFFFSSQNCNSGVLEIMKRVLFPGVILIWIGFGLSICFWKSGKWNEKWNPNKKAKYIFQEMKKTKEKKGKRKSKETLREKRTSLNQRRKKRGII